LSNLNPHKVLSKDDFTLINLPALIHDIKLVTHWIEMDEEKSLTARFQCNSPCQGGNEMTFHFLPVGEGALEDKEIYFISEVNNVLTIISVPRNRYGPSVLELNPISHTSGDMSHEF
jgi:hypothetical protein